MSLEKKCFAAAAVTHGLLLLLVFVSSAFIPAKPKVEPGIEFELINIPLELVEDPNVIEGDRNAGTPQVAPKTDTPPPLTPVQPQVKQPEPKPQESVKPAPKDPTPVKPIKAPEPKREEIKKAERHVPTVDDFNLDKAKPLKKEAKQQKTETKFDLNKATTQKLKITSDSSKTSDSSDSKQREAQLAQLLGNVRSTINNTGSRVGLVPGAIFGPGSGAKMSYDMAVAKIYEREFQRRPIPSRGKNPVVEVEVTVKRDGSASGRIVRKAGYSQMDRTVQQVLDTIRKVMPFPSDFESDSRTIRFNFTLED